MILFVFSHPSPPGSFVLSYNFFWETFPLHRIKNDCTTWIWSKSKSSLLVDCIASRQDLCHTSFHRRGKSRGCEWDWNLPLTQGLKLIDWRFFQSSNIFVTLLQISGCISHEVVTVDSGWRIGMDWVQNKKETHCWRLLTRRSVRIMAAPWVSSSLWGEPESWKLWELWLWPAARTVTSGRWLTRCSRREEESSAGGGPATALCCSAGLSSYT